MLHQALYFCIPLFFLIFSISSESITNSSNIYIQCSQIYFNSMTPYESNLNSLFNSLLDSSSISNFNKFQISPPGYLEPDVVYGLFQCRGYLNTSNCKDCVTNAVSQLKTNCPFSIGGGIQLDKCFVKYDNSLFFGAQDKMEVFNKCGPSVGSKSDVLNQTNAVLAYLVSGNRQYFRSGDYGSIQGVAQCVQDLSESDCQDCLSEAHGRLRSKCDTSTSGDMYLGKCYIIYVDQGDDNRGKKCTSNCSNSGEEGKDNNIWKVIGYIAAALAGGGLTLSVALTVKNSCNTYITQKEVDKLKRETEIAKVAKEAKKKEKKAAEEVAKMHPYCGRPMPNPYPYRSTESWCFYEV